MRVDQAFALKSPHSYFGGSNDSAFVPDAGAATAAPGATAPATTTPVGLFVSNGGGTAPFTRVLNTPPPTLDYHEALIADLTTGDIFFGDQDSSRWPLASVTKLMTAIVASDTLSASQQVTITPTDFAVDPNDTTLSVGDTYTVSDLMHIMLLQSSNVAAVALADFYGQSRFMALMNARTATIGMSHTYYGDPSGLSSANESTADDLVLLAQYVYNNYPNILAITRTPSYTVTNLATGKKLTVRSINNFAGVPGFIGGKTGYTTVSDGNLLSIFSYENRPVLVIIMGTDDTARFDNTTTLYNWFKQNFR